MTPVRRPVKKCPHGRRRYQCRACDGASFCEHARLRYQCGDCGGAAICQHWRQRAHCCDCNNFVCQIQGCPRQKKPPVRRSALVRARALCVPLRMIVPQRLRLKYMGSKSWLAPHLDRLLGDVTVLHSPFFGSGKLEYYLAARRPALEVRGVDAFEPVANLHRCYLRQDPVFLRSLLRLAGRKVDRRFYFSRLLPGSQRGRAGRRAASRTSCCATASRESGASSHSSGRWP